MTLITDGYREQQEQMHAEHAEYGVAHRKHVDVIARTLAGNKFRTMIDYGAGKCGLTRELARVAHESGLLNGLEITSYDPGIPKLARPPESAQFVACIDVLEHVEPECTLDVLKHIQRLTERLCYLSIALTPAAKTLPDGRNAHINLMTGNEWLDLLLPLFTLRSAYCTDSELVFVGEPK